MAARRKRVSPERCAELLDLLAALPIETDEETTRRIRGPAFRLARTHELTAYDVIYLDLAARRGIALATRDKTLQRSAGAMNVGLIDA
jgi:predicted nucleic acid-binding protein